jgi:hypothetical protein
MPSFLCSNRYLLFSLLEDAALKPEEEARKNIDLLLEKPGWRAQSPAKPDRPRKPPASCP